MTKYFSSIGKTYADKMPTSQHSIEHYLSKISNNKSSIFLAPTTKS